MLPRATQIGQFLSFLSRRSAGDLVDPIQEFLADEPIATVVVGEVEELGEGENGMQVGVVGELVGARGGGEGSVGL